VKDISVRRLQYALFFISISIISYQIVLIQILSFVQWYHFAYLIISIAMLGFGAAGTILSLFKDKLLKKSDLILPLLMTLCGLTMPIAVHLSQLSSIRFDTMLFFTGNYQIARLLLNYLIFTVPFLLGALAIGIIFIKHADSIGKLYFSNLMGSGIGGIIILILIWIFFPEKLSAIIGSFAVISGVMIYKRFDVKFFFFVLASFIILFLSFLYSPEFQPSEFKSRSKTLMLQDAKIIDKQSGPYGILEIISSPMIRNADGLSLNFKGEIKSGHAIFCNGDFIGTLLSQVQKDSSSFLHFTTAQLSYVMKKRDKVLILNSGSGNEIIRSLNAGTESVSAVEPNTQLMELLSKKYPVLNDSVYPNNKVSVYNTNARSFLLSSNEKYDLIILPAIGAFGGTSGLFSLNEQYHLTREALDDMLSQLNSDGVLMFNVWLDYPPRNSIKIIATIAETLENQNLKNLKNYIAAIKNWNYLTIVVKKTPITAKEELIVREFCTDMCFDIVSLPNLRVQERDRFNKMPDNRFYLLLDEIFNSKYNKLSLYSKYAFNITPATDDKPFFSQFLKWNNIGLLKKEFGNQNIPFIELGYVMLYVTLFQIIIAAFVLIILPLFKIGITGVNKIVVLIYYGGLGLGFMFTEMVFIQMYTLYFGNPIYSAATVICLMLICAGTGSYLTHSSKFFNRNFKLAMVFIAALLLIEALILKWILFSTIQYSLSTKILISFLLISPCAFFMGIPFPVGIEKTLTFSPSLIPWAWGINGLTSVLATVLATVIAIEFGFTVVFICAALFYLLALISAQTFKIDF
jgi:spermidine synthase